MLAGWSANAQQVIQNGVPIGAGTSQSTATVINVPAGGDVVGAVAAVAQSGGGTVNLAAGNYSINSSINLGSNVTINGQGSSTVIYAPPTPNGLAMIAAANGGVSNVIIENLVLDGSIPLGAFYDTVTYGGSGYANSGIYVYGNNNGASNILVKNVEIRNTGIGILMTVTNSITLNNVYVHDNNPGNFSHNAYLVGCDFVYVLHSRFMHAHTGDGLHFDFSASYYLITKSEFSQNHGEGVLDQGSSNINVQDSIFNWNVNDGYNASSSGELLTRSIASFNGGYGFNIQGGESSFDLAGFGDGEGIGFFNYSAGTFGALVNGTTANQYLAVLANGVTGATDTADWVTSISGYQGGALSGYSQIGAVDFNQNHLANGLLTFPAVGVVGSGSYTLSWTYSNGTSSTLTMPLSVNGQSAGTIVFPTTGSWSTWGVATVQATLNDGGNTISVSPTAPAAPLLDYLQVKTSVPSPPAAPTGLTVEPTGSHSTQLSWNPVPGASSYNVTRSSGTPTAFSYAAVGVTGTGYTDTDILIGGSTWYYEVQAANQGGGGGTTQPVGATTPVDAPSGLQAAAQPNGNVLTWMSANGAASYNVLRGSVAGGPYTPLATVTNASGSGQSYTDSTATPNATAYYVVQTVSSSGSPSVYSYQVNALTAPSPGSINVTLSTATLTLLPGTGNSLAVGVSYGAGVSGAATFSATGLPANVNIAFTPTSSSSGTTFIVYVQPTAAPGSYPITVTATAGSVVGSARLTLIIPQSQTITFPPIGAQTVGTPLLLSATASSGLNVTFTTTTSAVCTITGTTAVFLSPGTCTINAAQPGNGLYTAAPTVTQSFTVSLAPSFTLTPSAASLALRQGSSASDTITVTPANGFTGTVHYTATGLPSGVSASFTGNTLSLTASASAAPGNVLLKITGTSGSATASTSVSLTVTAAPSFTLGLGTSSLVVPQNSGTTDAISITPLNGFTGTVTFAVSGMPSGANSAFVGNEFVIFVPASIPLGTYALTISGTSGAASATTPLSLSVTAAAGFSLSAGSASLTLTQGQSGSTAIAVKDLNGFTGAVAFSASGFPSGVTGTFSPSSSTSGTSLQISAALNAAAGTYPIVVQGNSGATPSSNAISATTPLTLIIKAAPTFSLAPTASALNLQQNSGTTDAINVTALNGFSGSVALSATGIPAGSSSAFQGNTFVLYVGPSTPTGRYPITITGVSGTTSVSTTITLTVTAASGFTLSPATASLTIKPRASGSDILTIQATNGFASAVSFSAAGLPAGAAASFSPASSSSGSTLTVTAGLRTVAGSYPITVTGTSAATASSRSITATATITLVIAP